MMTDEEMEKMNYIRKRRSFMDENRQQYQQKRDTFDRQWAANAEQRQDGRANPHIPMEQELIEAYIGGLPDALPVRVKSTGRVNGWQLQMAEAILEHFIQRENTREEISDWDEKKARYGTGILFSGVRQDSQYVTTNIDSFYDDEATQELKKVYHIGIKTVDIRKVWFDERARKYKDCMDCIRQEDITIEDFRMRYMKDNETPIDWFKYIESVGTYESDEEEVQTDYLWHSGRNVKLRHYFNKLNGDYVLIANKYRVIHMWQTPYKHNQLPFIPVQHYSNSESIYGIGICERISSIKPYYNNFLKVALDSAWLAASNMVFHNTEVSVEGQIYVEPGELNFIPMNGDLGTNVQPYSPKSATWDVVPILQLLQELTLETTGESAKPNIYGWDITAFQAGLMKEEVNTRKRGVIRNRNFGLQRAFQMMLTNLAQFWPTQYAAQLFNENWPEDFDWYEIRVDNYKLVEREEEGETFKALEEDPGATAFFHFTSDLLRNGESMKVHVETPSTQSLSRFIERQEMGSYFQYIQMIKAMYPETDLWDWQDIKRRIDDLFDMDGNNYMVKSKEDKMRARISEIEGAMNAFVWPLWGQQALPTNQLGDETTTWENIQDQDNQQGWIWDVAAQFWA